MCCSLILIFPSFYFINNFSSFSLSHNPQIIIQNLTTYTIYEVKVQAATLSVINPRRVILGLHSTPKRVSEKKTILIEIDFCVLPFFVWNHRKMRGCSYEKWPKSKLNIRSELKALSEVSTFFLCEGVKRRIQSEVLFLCCSVLHETLKITLMFHET